MSSKLRQTQYWTPIRGQHSEPIDTRQRVEDAYERKYSGHCTANR